MGSFDALPGFAFCPVILADNGVETNYGSLGTLVSGTDGNLDGAGAPYLEGARLGVIANTGGIAFSGDFRVRYTATGYELDAWAFLGLGPLYVSGKLASTDLSAFTFLEEARGGFSIAFGWPGLKFAISPEVMLDVPAMKLYGRAQAAVAISLGGFQIAASARLQTGDLLSTFLTDPLGFEAGAELGFRLGGYFWLVASADFSFLPGFSLLRAGLYYRLMF
jgi:hypothetical protein